MQVHLCRCRQNYPDEKKVPCPFNATHIVPQCELEYHVASCKDQKSLVSQLIEYDSEERFFEPVPIINTVLECSENWDNVNVPTYDPTEHLENTPVIRHIQGMPPSQRRALYEQENRRIEALKERQNKTNVGSSMNDDKVTVFRRPNTVSALKKPTPVVNDARDQRSHTSTRPIATSTEYDYSTQSEFEISKELGKMSLKNDNDEFIPVPSRKKSNLSARGRKKNLVNYN